MIETTVPLYGKLCAIRVRKERSGGYFELQTLTRSDEIQENKA